MINIIFSLVVLLSSSMTLERVVAVVGSEPVLHSDVVSLMIEAGVSQEDAFTSDYLSPAYTLAMQQLIEDKLLVEAARREGYYPTRDDIETAVDDAMEGIRSTFRTEQELLNYLTSMGMTISSLRESYSSMLGDKIAGENYVQAKASTAMSGIPSDPISFFETNPELVEEVLDPSNLSWVYLPVLSSNTSQLEERLTEVKENILQGETTFSAAAVAFSEDGSAASGGDLGWFSRGDMTAAFEKVVYSLQPGEIAGPFLTPFGVHLVKLTDISGDSVRASHIIILAEVLPSDVDSTLAEAEYLIDEINNGTLSFADVVADYSCDPSPLNVNGNLGTVNIGAWEGAMQESVEELLPGEISSPVLIEQGMAVAFFKSNLEQQVNWDAFSEEELLSMLQSVFWHNYYNGLLESLREEIPVIVNVTVEQ